MRALKHVGRLINTDRRVIVVFREIPDEPESCLIVDTDALVDWMHDGIINAVESPGGQASANFYEYASRQSFSDGTNMLNTLHLKGLLRKQATSNVMMTPTTEAKVLLADLNVIINEQNGGAPVVAEAKSTDAVASWETTAPTVPTTEVVDDAALAQKLLAQADQFEAEATRLREEAEQLVPAPAPKKRSRKKTAADA